MTRVKRSEIHHLRGYEVWA